MLEIDYEGWQAQNSGRELWELIREGVQNALDTGCDIRVLVNTRKREITIEDDGSGYEELSEAWTVFQGSKGNDVDKRGRFGRGIKELITACEELRVETTCGMVRFDVQREQKFVDEEFARERGTKVVARNSEWSAEEMRGVREWLEKMWVPEGQEIVVDVKGGGDIEKSRSEWEPDFTFSTILDTVKFSTGGVKEEVRERAEVEVIRAKKGQGRIYEMEIPVNMGEEFPYWINVQQKIPMAEQRNSAERDFINRIVCKVVNRDIENLSKSQLQQEWLTSRLGDFKMDTQTRRVWAERVHGEDTVLKSTPHADDRAKRKGMNVLDASRLSRGQQKAAEDAFQKSKEWVTEYDTKNEGQQVEPTEEQEEFISEVREKILSEVDMTHIEIEMWELPNDDKGNIPEGRYTDGVVKLNVNIREWVEFNERNVALVLHELAHEGTTGHGDGYIRRLQELGAKLALSYME